MPLSSDQVGDILSLNELMETASTHGDTTRWIRDTLRATTTKGSRIDSASNRSVDRGRPPQEAPSIGRGDSKRATTSGTSDIDFPSRTRGEVGTSTRLEGKLSLAIFTRYISQIAMRPLLHPGLLDAVTTSHIPQCTAPR